MKLLKKCFSICMLLATLSLTACGSNQNIPLTLSPSFYLSDVSLEINILDTGESESIFIETDDYTIIIDSGLDESESTLLEFIIYHEVDKIDYLIITHPSEDHMDRINTLSNYSEIGRIFHPNFVQNTPNDEEKTEVDPNIGIITLKAEEEFTIRINGLMVNIYPTLKDESSELNSYSLITSLQYSNQFLLFAGDADHDYLNAFILKNESEYTILKMPHHGVDPESLEQFLTSINPSYSILTCSEDLEPNTEILQILADNNIQTFFTSDGKINIRINNEVHNITQHLNKFTLM